MRSVFDVYAHEYDLITNAAAREAYHSKEVAAIVEKLAPSSVLDAGCATGLTSLLFARLGIPTTGLDRSRSIINIARDRYKDSPLPLTFRTGNFERLPKSLHNKFDLVVCLANAISGVGTRANLRKALKGFYDVLRPGGHLLVQALNYAAIKDGAIMPIKATRNGDIVYLRYSRRRGKAFELYVIRLDLSNESISFEPFCAEFDNFTVDEITSAVRATGFDDIRKTSDLYLKRRFGTRSRDLVLQVRRPLSGDRLEQNARLVDTQGRPIAKHKGTI
ncbi:MAG: class I SAM-dependent methyltransferase [candidate division Zixibacteria bacterium]|nr:class I SAM-dependent methyltransferase [candidate division Zixibacteria bacterium]